jgi:UDP-N-acetylglucosamine 1-carboxyvinyltransferase
MQNNHNIIISQGPVCLKGSIRISGSKNASLPLLAATLLFKNKVVFNNLPHLDDIGTLAALLASIGSEVEWINDGLTVDHKDKKSLYIDPDMANKIRGSILLLGPILARYGEIRLPMPGGCPIGKRPIDFHIHALEQLGATFIVEDHQIYGVAPLGLKGAHIRFPKPTVTAQQQAKLQQQHQTQLVNQIHKSLANANTQQRITPQNGTQQIGSTVLKK